MVPKTDSVFPHCTHLECVAAPTHHESTRHPGRGLAEQGSQAGGLAAQRLGSNPAPVKTCTSGAENHSISLRVVGAGESKTCHSVTHRSASPQSPTTRSQAVIHVQSIPSTFHLPQNTNSELLSVALTQGSMNTKLGMQKPGVHIKPPEFKQASTG